jgi:predicted O-methyltransferase YrrM
VDVLSRTKSFRNILHFSLQSRYRTEMWRKVGNRIDGLRNARKDSQAAAWYESQAVAFNEFAAAKDARLWEESLEAADAAKRRARERLNAVGETMGGGTASMLYFLVRMRNPQCVVETGVAAGFSSQAILQALEINAQGGRLFSSDFPYFRKKDPESLVGIAVEPALREKWTLYLEGDRANLPRILRTCGPIDLLVYDSDKSRAGRAFAMDYLVPRMTDTGLIVMDDIDDNDFFKEFVAGAASDFRIFRYNGRHVGVVEVSSLRKPRDK